jgi:hypothetical protein
MSCKQDAGQNHNILVKIDDKFLERVEHLKYLGTILTNQNFIHEKIQTTVKSGNACYHLKQNFCLHTDCHQKIQRLNYTEL